MARPKVLHVEDGGEIVLRNLSKEKSDKVIALLTNKELTTAPLEEREEVEQPVDETLNNTSFGIIKNNDGHWCVVEVSYNLETKHAVVSKVTNYGESGKYVAFDEFKVKAARTLM